MKKNLISFLKKIKSLSILATVALMIGAIQPANADITEAQIKQFAQKLSQAANQKNISQISRLVDDKVLISLSRNRRTTTLNKDSYLKLLQDNWAKTANYHYQISINNVLIAGDQAKADIQTIETMTENGRAERLITTSRATFAAPATGVMLLRAVSQLTIE